MDAMAKRLSWWIIGLLVLSVVIWQFIKPVRPAYLPYDAQEKEAHP